MKSGKKIAVQQTRFSLLGKSEKKNTGAHTLLFRQEKMWRELSKLKNWEKIKNRKYVYDATVLKKEEKTNKRTMLTYKL